jgi:hypothetical protein
VQLDSPYVGPWLANNIRLCAGGLATEMSYWTFTFDLRFLTIFSGLARELGSRRSVMDPTKDFPKHQRNLIEDFLCAYNTIDKNLRQRLNVDRKLSFVQMVKDFSREHPAWLNVDLLETAADGHHYPLGHSSDVRGDIEPSFGRTRQIALQELVVEAIKRQRVGD